MFRLAMVHKFYSLSFNANIMNSVCYRAQKELILRKLGLEDPDILKLASDLP